MRIAFFSSQAFSLYNFRGSLIAKLISDGHEVLAFAPDFDKKSRSQIIGLGANPVDCPISRTGMNPVRDFFDVIKIAILFRKYKIDCLFSYFIKPVIYGNLAGWLAGISKKVSIIEGAGTIFSSEKDNGLIQKIVIFLYRLGVSKCDRVVFLNQDDIDLFLSHKIVDIEKIDLIKGIGIDLERFKFAEVEGGPVSFIMIARLLREKGIYDYIDSIKIVKKVYPDIKFYLLGNIDLNPGSVTQTEVNSWVKSGLIEWPGQVEKVEEWIKKAHVFVLPSYYREGLPRSTQEAMAIGRAVITTDWVGCKETVKNEVNGFLIPIKSPEVLAEKILCFIRNPELAISMGRESRRIAEEEFDVVKINKKIIEVILNK